MAKIKLGSDLIRTNVFLSRDERTELIRIGKEQKLSAAEVLRRILDKALDLTTGNPWVAPSVFTNRPVKLRGATNQQA